MTEELNFKFIGSLLEILTRTSLTIVIAEPNKIPGNRVETGLMTKESAMKFVLLVTNNLISSYLNEKQRALDARMSKSYIEKLDAQIMDLYILRKDVLKRLSPDDFCELMG